MKKISKISIISFISITLYVILNLLWDSKLTDMISSLPAPIAGLINNYIAPVSIISFFFACILLFLWKVPVARKLTQWGFDTNTYIKGLWIGKMYFQWEGKGGIAFIDKEKGIERLIYTYDAEKAIKSSETNPQHSGITILTIGENKKILSGEYFTNQKTAGRIELKFLSRKNASSFKDAAIIFQKMQKKKKLFNILFLTYIKYPYHNFFLFPKKHAEFSSNSRREI